MNNVQIDQIPVEIQSTNSSQNGNGVGITPNRRPFPIFIQINQQQIKYTADIIILMKLTMETTVH